MCFFFVPSSGCFSLCSVLAPAFNLLVLCPYIHGVAADDLESYPGLIFFALVLLITWEGPLESNQRKLFWWSIQFQSWQSSVLLIAGSEPSRSISLSGPRFSVIPHDYLVVAIVSLSISLATNLATSFVINVRLKCISLTDLNKDRAS